MNCYFCEQIPGPGGTNIRDISADGICHECGVAVCRKHGHKEANPGSTLRCPDCVESHVATTTSNHGSVSQLA
jgi:hypothetical protein